MVNMLRVLSFEDFCSSWNHTFLHYDPTAPATADMAPPAEILKSQRPSLICYTNCCALTFSETFSRQTAPVSLLRPEKQRASSSWLGRAW